MTILLSDDNPVYQMTIPFIGITGNPVYQTSGLLTIPFIRITNRDFLVGLGAFVGFFQMLAGFVERALGIVVCLGSLAVFVDRSLALPGDIENLAELNVAPDFCPARIAVAVERVTISICGGLVVFLQEEDFGDAVMRERTVF